MSQYIHTFTNFWLTWYHIVVEVDKNKALPTIEIIGLPDAAIKESKERIRASFRTLWIQLPPNKIILNLAPSNIKKVWTRFDLPMAVAILWLIITPTSQTKELLDTSLFFWELGLDGAIKNVNWLLPSIISASKQWWKRFFVPSCHALELSYIPWIDVYGMSNFADVEAILSWTTSLATFQVDHNTSLPVSSTSWLVDFCEIKWHLVPKRALMIAAAWMHNVLMSWPPGSGKSMLAKALQSILPPMTFDQCIDVSQIYSLVWALTTDTPLITTRPFRSVHHTASRISIVWWGRNMSPWEISLAHHGILFFDELPEFPWEVLEVLRQPLEEKKVVISRANWSVEYPANFMFVAAMNPCKCWFYQDPQKHCTCSIHSIKRYQWKISWPILDRFDMILSIPREHIDTIMNDSSQETSTQIQQKVTTAREIQKKRYSQEPVVSNAHLSAKMIARYVRMSSDAELFVKEVSKRLSLSPRVTHRTIKLARTIADMASTDTIQKTHIAEAFQFREKTFVQ